MPLAEARDEPRSAPDARPRTSPVVVPEARELDACIDQLGRSLSSILLSSSETSLDLECSDKNKKVCIGRVMYNEWRYRPTTREINKMAKIKENIEGVEAHWEFAHKARALSAMCREDRNQNVDLVRELGAGRGASGFDTSGEWTSWMGVRLKIDKLSKALYEKVYQGAKHWLLQVDYWMRQKEASTRRCPSHQSELLEPTHSDHFDSVVHKMASAIARRASMHDDFAGDERDSLFAVDYLSSEYLIAQIQLQMDLDCKGDTFSRDTEIAVMQWAEVHKDSVGSLVSRFRRRAEDEVLRSRALKVASVRCCGAADACDVTCHDEFPSLGVVDLCFEWAWRDEREAVRSRRELRGEKLRVAMLASMLLELKSRGELKEGIVSASALRQACDVTEKQYKVAICTLDLERLLGSVGFKAADLLNAFHDHSSAIADKVDAALVEMRHFSISFIETLFGRHLPDGSPNPLRPVLAARLEKNVRAWMGNRATPSVPLSYFLLSMEALDDLLLPALKQRRAQIGLHPARAPSVMGEILRTICKLKKWTPRDGQVVITKEDLVGAHSLTRSVLENHARKHDTKLVALHVANSGERTRKAVRFEFRCTTELWHLLHT